MAEPLSGTIPVTITAERTGGSEGVASVDVAVTGGTAVEGDDYTLPGSPVTLSWADGESGPKSFDITIKADSLAEPTETIELSLQNAQGMELGTPSTATISVFDADPTPPTLTLTAPNANGKITGESVTFSGSAKDNAGIARVEVALNGGAPQSVAPPAVAKDFDWTLTLTPEQGLNTAVVTAFDLAGNASAAITRSFNFTNLRPQLAGSYNGLIVDADATALFERTGFVSVNVGPTGMFTGKVTISGLTLPISGVFLSGGGARFGRLLTPSFELVRLATNNSLGFLALSLDTGSGKKITGSIRDAGSTVLATIPQANLASYNVKGNPVPAKLRDPAKEIGKYTGVLNPGAAIVGAPGGSGYGTLTISSAGIAKLVGKAADGSAFIASAPVVPDAGVADRFHWPLFAQLYAKRGFIAGDIVFDPAQPQTDASGACIWFKPADLPRQRLYPAGWPAGIEVDFDASKYLKPATPLNPGTILGIAGAPSPAITNIEVALNAGGLPTDARNDASIDGRSKVTVLGATVGSATTNLKVTFGTGNGALGGSFTHPGNGKTVKFAGTVLQKMNAAFGCFLYEPTAGTAAAGGVGVFRK